MTCRRSGNGYMCFTENAFTFRFIIWRCEFVNAPYGGPIWHLSYPWIDIEEFKAYHRIGDSLWFCFKSIFVMKERDNLYLGEHNILWKVFNYHYNKWVNNIKEDIPCQKK